MENAEYLVHVALVNLALQDAVGQVGFVLLAGQSVVIGVYSV